MRDLMNSAEAAKSNVGISAACQSLALPRATFYRWRKPRVAAATIHGRTCRVPGRALSAEEQQRAITELDSERFMDKAPPQVYATLLDEDTYLCSISTMYRLLRKRGEVKDRRRQRSHVPAQRPELLATGPNQVWSWDITKLKGPRKWSYLHLYVIIDVFSRFVVGWCISEESNALIAEALITDAISRENVKPGELTIHADNGGEMTSITVAELLTDLGVVKSHSRPHTSNDNPFSESHFKTMKYRPEIPARFESAEYARVIFRMLFHWYNQEHRHSSLALLSPATVHAGKAAQVTQARAGVLSAAYSAHPERFVNKPPVPAAPPAEVWINAPSTCSEASRDASEQVEACAMPIGRQELLDTHTSGHKRASRQSSPESSRDASGGRHATTA
jgi:putative transposase